MPNQIDRIYINFINPINNQTANNIIQTCSNLITNHSPKELYFQFSSPGGDVNAGIYLYNFLKSLPVKIIMHNIGIVDSIGTIVFASGDERYASSNSSFLFHGVGITFQNVTLKYNQLSEFLSQVESDQIKIASILQKNSNLNQEEILSFFNKGETKNPEFAKEKGFILNIYESIIPEGASIVTI